MSSYWAGYHGTALVLKEEEYVAFLHKYAEVQKKNETDLMEEIDEIGLCEFEFTYGTDPSKRFFITELLTDENDGMYLYPYMNDGHPNICNEEQDWSAKAYNLRSYNLYVMFSDKALDSPKAFFGKPIYSSYEELSNEFKNKIGAYLPADFDWDSHIGSLSYAAFA